MIRATPPHPGSLTFHFSFISAVRRYSKRSFLLQVSPLKPSVLSLHPCMCHRHICIFFLSFNLLIGLQLSIWNCCKPFFSLLYNCQLLCFLQLALSTAVFATCFKYCSRGLPTAFFPDIAPSRVSLQTCFAYMPYP